jgi:protein TonB
MSAVLTNAIHSGPHLRGRVSSLDVGVAASVVLHAVLLFAVAGAHESIRWEPVSPGPILARLVAIEPAAEPSEAPAHEAEPPRPLAAPVATIESRPAPTVAEPPAVSSRPAPIALAPSETVAPAASERAVPASLSQASAAAAARTDAQPLAAARPAGAAALRIEPPDPKSVAQYRGAVSAAARRYKVYPRVAMDNNWEGRVEVRMVIGAGGSIASIRVTSSAGYEVLDAQALDMIRRAAPEAPLPETLRGREFAVDVQVIFSLQDPSA